MALILGTAASETLNGTESDDEFIGGPGDDTLNGLGGNDIFRWFSGDGNDAIDGGAGQDKAVVTFTDNTGVSGQQFRLISDPAGGRAFVQFGTGAAGNPTTFVNVLRNVEDVQLRITEAVSLGAATIFIGNLTGTGVTGIVEVDNLSTSNITINGTEAVNQLRLLGANGNEQLLGGLANDLIYGGAGNDFLFGGGGANEMVGGFGNDTYRATSADTVLEFAGEGTDTVVTSDASFALRDNLENLIFAEGSTGTPTNFTGIGNAGNNYIEGGLGADYLIGLDGNDTLAGGTGAANALQGGTGDDTYIVSVAGDSITEFAGEGNDTVQTSLSSYTLQDNVENLRFTGTADALGIGNDASNQLEGNAGRDALRGRGGDDLILGGAGNDFLDGGAGNDRIVGGLGADELRGGLGADLFIYTVVPDRPDLIHDFSHTDFDKIDVSDLLASIGATGDPFANGYLRLEQTTFAGLPSTRVFVDPDGSAGPNAEVVLIHVLGDVPLTQSDFITV